MEIFQALPDVHFRFAENGHLYRCCGHCGMALLRGEADPCVDQAPCIQRKVESRQPHSKPAISN